MKLSEMFIGQIVMLNGYEKEQIPLVGKVVDIALQYNTKILINSNSDNKIDVLPVIHFVGETIPRLVNPANLEKYKEK